MPTRMSTFSNSAQVRPMRALRERGEPDARVVVLEDLARGIAELRHGLGARLIQPHPVAVAAPGEARQATIHRHREERALEHVVADQTSEVVTAQDEAPPTALHRDARHAK